MAATLSALGKLDLRAGDIAKAKEHLEESLCMTHLFSGTCHPDTAPTLLVRGNLYFQDGDATKAGNCLEKSLLMTLRLLPDIGDNDTAAKAAKAANAAKLLASGEECLKARDSQYFHQAANLLEAALLMTRSCLGDTSHPEIAPRLLALGKLLHLQAGDFTNSKTCLEESLRMTRSLLGDTNARHRGIAEALSALGKLELDAAAGNVTQAKEYLKESAHMSDPDAGSLDGLENPLFGF